MRPFIASLIVASMMLVLAAPAPADTLIPLVPDWNQPNPAEYPGDGLPPPIPPVGGTDAYPGWCSPTAGGNIMGYWEDVKGCLGLTDRQKFPLTTNYPGTAGTWEQGLYHDGIIEMGWQMDTGGWRTNVGPFPPYRLGGTLLVSILPGLLSYATGSWVDNDYPVAGSAGTGIVKNAFPQTAGFTQNVGATALGAMWATYVPAVNVAHPVEVSFTRWVNADLNQDVMVNGQWVHKYSWGAPLSEGHSVVGVGYIDPVPGYQNDGTEWFICQDGWGSTPQYVAVPVNSGFWTQNDYITHVPEPGTLALLIAAGLGLLAFGWRKRR